MQHPPLVIQSRFLHCFAEGRMRMADPREVFGVAAEFQGCSYLSDEVAGASAKNLCAEQLLGIRIADDLDQAIRIA